MDKKHTISVLVENKFGVLARVAGLFSGRGYNISSLTVNETHDPSISKMTIVTSGDDAILEQIDKQLNKLIDVIKVTDLTGSKFIERELALIKVKAPCDKRAEIIQVTEIFEGKIISVHKEELGIEIQGRAEKIDNFIQLISDFEIIEIARSGRVAMSREAGATEDLSSL
jgi:acetolactate synthase-1/3 small subunit